MSDDETTLTFVTESLPRFKVGENYEVWLQVDGGVPPITFELEEGEFPAGIGLSSEGMVYGLPLEQDTGDSTVFITASDSTGASDTQAFDCEVHQHEVDDEDEGS